MSIFSRWWLRVLLILIVAAIIILPPHDLVAKSDLAASAVCHRLPDRSYFLGGRQLPLCARCSGTYLAALAGIIILFARRRSASHLPPLRMLPIFGLFVGAWAVDGANSYLTLFPTLPHLYEPHNLLRLVTGTLLGLTIAIYLVPLVNMTVWTEPAPIPSVRGRHDLVPLAAAAGVVVALVSSGLTALLYPLALLSGVSILVLVGILNSLLILVAWHQDGTARTWNDLVAPLACGLALAAVELGLAALLRSWLTARLGLPF